MGTDTSLIQIGFSLKPDAFITVSAVLSTTVIAFFIFANTLISEKSGKEIIPLDKTIIRETWLSPGKLIFFLSFLFFPYFLSVFQFECSLKSFFDLICFILIFIGILWSFLVIYKISNKTQLLKEDIINERKKYLKSKIRSRMNWSDNWKDHQSIKDWPLVHEDLIRHLMERYFDHPNYYLYLMDLSENVIQENALYVFREFSLAYFNSNNYSFEIKYRLLEGIKKSVPFLVGSGYQLKPVLEDCLNFSISNDKEWKEYLHSFLPSLFDSLSDSAEKGALVESFLEDILVVDFQITIENVNESEIACYWFNEYIAWAHKRFQECTEFYDSKHEAILHALFPEVSTRLWADFIRLCFIYMFCDYSLNRKSNFGCIGRVELAGTSQELEQLFEKRIIDTYKLAKQLFRKIRRSPDIEKDIENKLEDAIKNNSGSIAEDLYSFHQKIIKTRTNS